MPAGWWHCVLNEGFTAAVTQNFLREADAQRLAPKLAQSHPSLLEALREAGVCN